MDKVTARACSNVALLKYWGRRDGGIRLPANNSISVNLSGLTTTTVIEDSSKDVVVIDGEELRRGDKGFERVVEFLDLAAGESRRSCRVMSENSFPAATGLSSSASGFAALATAANGFFGLGLGERKLSVLARKGSGSATRSIPEGVVRWVSAGSDGESYAETVLDSGYWDLVVFALVLCCKAKEVPTSDGHKLAWSSPYFEARLRVIGEREKELMRALEKKDFGKLAMVCEREMMEFHAIPMTSVPPLFYWYPTTVEVIRAVRKWRSEGLPVFSTVNTGHNVFVFTLPKGKKEVEEKIGSLSVVEELIESRVGEGAGVVN